MTVRGIDACKGADACRGSPVGRAPVGIPLACRLHQLEGLKDPCVVGDVAEPDWLRIEEIQRLGGAQGTVIGEEAQKGDPDGMLQGTGGPESVGM